MPHFVLPNSWVLLAALVVLAALVAHLVRAPRDYPFRGTALCAGVTMILALAAVLIVRGVTKGTAVIAHAGELRKHYLESRPADSLARYVSLLPGSDTVHIVPAAAHERIGQTSTLWEAVSDSAPSAVIAWYRDPSHHAGWSAEFSAPTMLVLVRDRQALGGHGKERLRIQARRGTEVDMRETAGAGVATLTAGGGGTAGAGRARRTVVEYELTRRF